MARCVARSMVGCMVLRIVGTMDCALILALLARLVQFRCEFAQLGWQ